jgi:hypothetical protein
MENCIDLAERFGNRFRVTYEPAYQAEHGPRAWVNDPWLKIIPCQHGHIFPWGGTRLAAASNTVGPTAKTLRGLPWVEVAQDGSDGTTVVFDVSRFEEIAEIMKPKRKRVLSDEAKRRLAEAGTKTQFRHGIRIAPENAVCVPGA